MLDSLGPCVTCWDPFWAIVDNVGYFGTVVEKRSGPCSITVDDVWAYLVQTLTMLGTIAGQSFDNYGQLGTIS